jgi:predicted nucleotide-binding protein (sugar kinase/HSP70/actin superfamily)
MDTERVVQYECKVCGRRIDVTRAGDVYEEPIYCCGVTATEPGAIAPAVKKAVKAVKKARKAVKKAVKKAKKAVKKAKKAVKKAVKAVKKAKKAVKKAGKKKTVISPDRQTGPLTERSGGFFRQGQLYARGGRSAWKQQLTTAYQK